MADGDRRHPSNEEILKAVQELEAKIVAHEQEHHPLTSEQIKRMFKEHGEMLTRQLTLDRDLSVLADDYLGEKYEDFDGNVQRRKGTKDLIRRQTRDVAEMRHKMSNGGLPSKVKLTHGQKVTVGIILGTMIATALQAFFGGG